MNNKVFFDNVVDIGTLSLDFVFIEFEFEPILFTCIDATNQLYLCLCSEIRAEKKWLVSKLRPQDLSKLVNGTLDIDSALKINDKLIVITQKISGEEISVRRLISELDPLDFPESGAKLVVYDSEGVQQYLNSFNCLVFDSSMRHEDTLEFSSTYVYDISEKPQFNVRTLQIEHTKNHADFLFFSPNYKPEQCTTSFCVPFCTKQTVQYNENSIITAELDVEACVA